MTPFLGPLARLLRTNFTAYSFVKQSQMPSQATIMKSKESLITTFLISGNDVTRCFLHSSMFFNMSSFFGGASSFFSSSFLDFLIFVDFLFSSCYRRLGFLYSQSPIALETAMTPCTLLSSTNPPPAFIRLNSSSLSGLWSYDSSVILPLLSAITARESPEFAQ